MADDDECAGPVVEKVLEHSQRLDVEVVGGLVEQEDVGLLGEHREQLQSAALAAREFTDAGEGEIAGEPEALHQGDVLERSGTALGAGDDVLDSQIGVERGAVLVVVADDDGRAGVHGADGREPPAGKQVSALAVKAICVIRPHLQHKKNPASAGLFFVEAFINGNCSS